MLESDLDDRVVELLNSLRMDQALYLVKQVGESNLVGVQHKASFMMAVVRNFRDRLRAMGPQAAISQQLLRTPDRATLQVRLLSSSLPFRLSFSN